MANSKCPRLPWMIDFHKSRDSGVLRNQLKSLAAKTPLKQKIGLDIRSLPPKIRLTQIVCTIPPDIKIETLKKLFSHGMTVAKLKMIDYPDKESVRNVMVKIREVNDMYSIEIGRVFPLPIAMELIGNSIRTGKIKLSQKSLTLKEGDKTSIVTDKDYEDFVDGDNIFVNFPLITKLVKQGDKIYLGGNQVRLSALDCTEFILKCVVEKAGTILGNDIVSVAGVPLDVPTITEKDEKNLQYAMELGADFLFLSGITKAENVKEFKEKLQERNRNILLISKIDNLLGLDNVDEIIKESDGIILDIETLISELGRAKIFLVLKSVTAKCHYAEKPVLYTLEFQNLLKADIVDIATVVSDGIDCLILNQNPEEETEYFQNLKDLTPICIEAEMAMMSKQFLHDIVEKEQYPKELLQILGMEVVDTSIKLQAAAIVIVTVSGRAAQTLSSYKPRCPIIAITKNERVAQQLHLYRAIDSLLYLKDDINDWEKDSELRIQLGITYGKYSGFIKAGDPVITIKANRPGAGFCNIIKVIYASRIDTKSKLFVR